MFEPDLDRFSRPLWGEKRILDRTISEDEQAEYDEIEREIRAEKRKQQIEEEDDSNEQE